jgi:hypothetical protein
VLDGDAINDIEKGILLAVRPDISQFADTSKRENFVEIPWICEAVDNVSSDGNITVQWYKGSINGSWFPETLKCAKSKNSKHCDIVPANSVYLWGFKLLRNKHLEKNAKCTIMCEMKDVQKLYDTHLNRNFVPHGDPVLDSSDSE